MSVSPDVVGLDAAGLLVAAVAAFAAGIINAVAGGGTIVAFPALTSAGLGATAANVTCTVALAPGYASGAAAQRGDLAGQRRRAAILVPTGVLGGLVGGVLLLSTGERLFRSVVPVLMLVASAILWAQPRIRSAVRARADGRADGPTSASVTPPADGGRERLAPWLVAGVFAASIYGGYFGAGLGIVMLAVLGLGIEDDLRRINALRLAVTFGVNGTAALFFIATAPVAWAAAVVMGVGAIAGGVVGARIGHRIREDVLRTVVVVTGVVVAFAYAVG